MSGTILCSAPSVDCCLLASQTLKAYLAEAQGACSVWCGQPQKVRKQAAETSVTSNAHEAVLQHLEQDLQLCAVPESAP